MLCLLCAKYFMVVRTADWNSTVLDICIEFCPSIVVSGLMQSAKPGAVQFCRYNISDLMTTN